MSLFSFICGGASSGTPLTANTGTGNAHAGPQRFTVGDAKLTTGLQQDKAATRDDINLYDYGVTRGTTIRKTYHQGDQVGVGEVVSYFGNTFRDLGSCVADKTKGSHGIGDYANYLVVSPAFHCVGLALQGVGLSVSAVTSVAEGVSSASSATAQYFEPVTSGITSSIGSAWDYMSAAANAVTRRV